MVAEVYLSLLYLSDDYVMGRKRLSRNILLQHAGLIDWETEFRR